MQLPWKLQLMHFLAGFGKPIAEQSLAELRQLDNLPDNFLVDMTMGTRRDMAQVRDMHIPGRDCDIPVRIYKPTHTENLPVVMFFHGGGFVLGSIHMYDRMCRRIADESGALVVSVEYRRAPEHRFPTALYDAYDTTLWAAEHIAAHGGDPSRLAVCGDSAGGGLAAGVVFMAHDLGKPMICQQILIYPTLDATLQSASINKYANAPVLRREDMLFFREQYIDEADYMHPYASVLHAKDLSFVPPTMIIVAEYDPLHDDGQSFAKQLQKAGRVVEYHDYKRQVHGFLTIPGIADRAKDAFADIATFLKTHFEQIAQPEHA